MLRERNNAILELIERLKREIGAAREYSLDRTVHLLQIALLDLRMTLHDISDDELRQLTDALDDVADAAETRRITLS